MIFLKFFICDDNKDFSRKLKDDIIKTFPDSQIDVFDTISSLMFTLEDEGQSVDGLFLDIENTDGNGIEAAAKIKEMFPLLKLVFVTGYGDEYSQDIFDCPVGCEPVAFLVKPVKEKYLALALEKIRASASTEEKYLSVSTNRETAFINENDIIYISSNRRKITIFTKNKAYTYYATLETLASKLSDKFCRCHKSYIVNLGLITSVDAKPAISLESGIEIPVGKSFLKNFKEQLVLYKVSNKRRTEND